VGLSPTNDGARIAVDAHREQRHSRGGFSGLLILHDLLNLGCPAPLWTKWQSGTNTIIRPNLDNNRIVLAST